MTADARAGHVEPIRGRHLVHLTAKLGMLNWLSLAAGFITGPNPRAEPRC